MGEGGRLRWDAGAAPGTRAALQAGGPMRASPGAQVCLRLSRAHAGAGTRKPDEGNVHRARAVQARLRSQRLLLSVASQDRSRVIAARRRWRGEGVLRDLWQPAWHLA